MSNKITEYCRAGKSPEPGHKIMDKAIFESAMNQICQVDKDRNNYLESIERNLSVPDIVSRAL